MSTGPDATEEAIPAAPSPQEMQQAVNGMRSAEKRSDVAYQTALRDNEETNRQLTMMAKGNDQLMAKIHQIGNRLAADPHQKSEKLQQRKQARLHKKYQRQYEKMKTLIFFWSNKFVQHIQEYNIYEEEERQHDESLQYIEAKLRKFGVDTDGLFESRKPPPIDPESIDMQKMAQIANDSSVQCEQDDEEQQLKDLQNMPDYVVTDESHGDNNSNVSPQSSMQGHHGTAATATADVNAAQQKTTSRPLVVPPSQPTPHYPGLSDMKPPSSLPTYAPIQKPPPAQWQVSSAPPQQPMPVPMQMPMHPTAPQYHFYGSLPAKQRFTPYQPMARTRQTEAQQKQNQHATATVTAGDEEAEEDGHDDDDDLLDDLDDEADAVSNVLALAQREYEQLRSQKQPSSRSMKAMPMKHATKVQIRATVEDDDMLDDLDDVDVPMNAYHNPLPPQNINAPTQQPIAIHGQNFQHTYTQAQHMYHPPQYTAQQPPQQVQMTAGGYPNISKPKSDNAAKSTYTYPNIYSQKHSSTIASDDDIILEDV